MLRKIVVAVAALALVHVMVVTTTALMCRPTIMPNGEVNSCNNCHINPSGGGIRNPYGVDVGVITGGLVGSCESREFWGPALAAEDSDGDGRTNGEELQDPDGLWQPGTPQPGNGLLVTNPGKSDDPIVLTFFRRADSNGNGVVDASDAVTTLTVLFLSQGQLECDDAADANDDGVVDIIDPLFALFALFVGENPVPAPGTDSCGEDPTQDSLACQTQSSCVP